MLGILFRRLPFRVLHLGAHSAVEYVVVLFLTFGQIGYSAVRRIVIEFLYLVRRDRLKITNEQIRHRTYTLKTASFSTFIHAYLIQEVRHHGHFRRHKLFAICRLIFLNLRTGHAVTTGLATELTQYFHIQSHSLFGEAGDRCPHAALDTRLFV